MQNSPEASATGYQDRIMARVTSTAPASSRPAPHADVPVPPPAVRLVRPGWRDPRLVVGVLLVCGSVLLGARLLSASDDTTAVWATRGPVAAGARLDQGDLTVARVRFGTAEESGFPGLQAEAWWGVFAPAGTPAPHIARMNAALRETLDEPRLRQQMEETQQARLVLSDPPALAAFVDRQVEIWGKVVRDNAIRAD